VNGFVGGIGRNEPSVDDPRRVRRDRLTMAVMGRRSGDKLCALPLAPVRDRLRRPARTARASPPVWLVLLGAILMGRAAKAEPAESTTHADTEDTAAFVLLIAPDGCATRDALVAGIKKQSDRVRFVERGQAQRALFAEIRAIAGRGFSAGFTLIRSSGRIAQRQVVAKTCAEALDALTLLATLALDPREDDKLVSANTPATNASTETPPTITVTQAQPKIVGAPETPSPQSSTSAPADGAYWTVAAGAGGLATWGPSPSTMPGVLLYAGVGWNQREPFSPWLRISASHVGREGIATRGGTAGFALDLVGLDVCPLGVAHFKLNLRACAAGTLGQLSAQGSATRLPQNLHRPFATLGGVALLSFEPGLRIELTAFFGVNAPLVRDSFQFRSDVFFQVRPVTATAGIGLGFRIL
jgi:hypothetical protein